MRGTHAGASSRPRATLRGMPDISASMERSQAERRFRALFDTHRALVLGYALRRVDEPADAADVVAETFLVAWRRLDDVPADALPWLYGVARRVIADSRRTSRRQEALTDRLAAVQEPSSTEPTETDPELLAALARLSTRERELLLLVHWEDLEPRRAALALGCARATVATRLWRAHRRLRTELDRMRGEQR